MAFKPRHRVRYEERIDDNEDYGDEPKPEWDKKCSPFRAEVLPIAGREIEDARKLENQVTHRVRLRFNKLVHAYGRFTLCGDGEPRIFEIHSVINEREENRFLRCFCIETTTLTKQLKKQIA